jgi:hypothetical protein
MSLNVLGVIQRAMRLVGHLAGGVTPDATSSADALTAFNAMKRAWYGTLIGPRLSPVALSGISGQAENGAECLIPGGAAFTLAAPGAPRSGDRFGAVDAGLAWTAFPLTVTHAGVLMNGAAANTTVSTAGQNTRWWFRGETGNWVIEADFTSLTQAIEFPDPVIAYMPYMLAQAMAGEWASQLSPEVEAAALEGRQVLARLYGRRGRANAEGPLGLPAAAQGQG